MCISIGRAPIEQPPGSDTRIPESRQERSKRQHGSSHCLHEFVGRFRVRHRLRVNRELAGRNVRRLDVALHVCEQFRHRDDVAHVGNIREVYLFIRQQGGGHGGQRGVFRAADAHRAFESPAAFDLKSVHCLAFA